MYLVLVWVKVVVKDVFGVLIELDVVFKLCFGYEDVVIFVVELCVDGDFDVVIVGLCSFLKVVLVFIDGYLMFVCLYFMCN